MVILGGSALILTKIYKMTLNKIPFKLDSKYMKNLKRHFLQRIFKNVGHNINVRQNIRFDLGWNISIGNNSGIGERCYLQDIEEISIGDNVLMAPEVLIYTANHKHRRDELIIKQGIYTDKVIIEDDVWIGTRAIILPGVTVGKGAVVAANAVITRNVQPYTIVGGVPAKKIGERN